MTNDKRIRLAVHLSTGALLALVSILEDFITNDNMLGDFAGWGPIQTLLLAVGILVMAIGLILPPGVVSRVSTSVCLSLLSLIVTLLLCEGVFRAVGFDFARQEQALQKLPVYYRLPSVPTGQVYFRRRGPEQWTGQVLNTMMKQANLLPNPYGNEEVITVTYDSKGFRNSDDLLNWDIAVAGDSFTELGYLPYDQLFTTLLGKMLNVAVLNLGASHTGPLTQLSYLQDYGVSPSTRHAVVVFFEGNDLGDLRLEYEALERFRETGQRESREFKQPSFVRALRDLLLSLKSPDRPTETVHAYFKSIRGDIPVTLNYAPPGSSGISPKSKAQLDYFFANYARFGRERNITVWLAFMPCKERVLHGQIRFTDEGSEQFKSWQPTDFPNEIARLSGQYGVRFIDLTSALVDETRSRRELVYNSIFDTHLNSLGSLVVAREMERHLATQILKLPNKALQPTR